MLAVFPDRVVRLFALRLLPDACWVARVEQRKGFGLRRRIEDVESK